MVRTAKQTWGVLSMLTLTGAFAARAADDHIIAGVVVDSQSHTPVSNMRVLLSATSARSQKLEQVTQQDGKFSFAVRNGGKYSLQVIKPGYPLQAYHQTVFATVSTAIVVRSDQDTTHITFEAHRGAVITGRVKDEDAEPVADAEVSVYQSMVTAGERKLVPRGQSHTNEAGEFRFSGLPRGAFYICVAGRPWFAESVNMLNQSQELMGKARSQALRRLREQKEVPTSAGEPANEPELPERSFSPDPNLRGIAFQSTCYPHGQTVEEATALRLDFGGEAQIALTLTLARSVSIKGTMNTGGEVGDGRVNLVKKIADQHLPFQQSWVSKEGTFEFKNVPSGSYEITAASQTSSGPSSWTIRQDIEVGTTNLEIQLRPSPFGSVSGHVRYEDPNHAGAVQFVSLRDEKGRLIRTQMDAEGNYSLTRLRLGHYELLATSTKYIAAYLMDPSGAQLPLTLDINSGEPLHRDVMLTTAVSAIEGTVEKDGAPQAGAFVLLIPKERRWDYRVDQADSDGSYRLASIPSGDYFLIALSDGENVAYRDAKIAGVLTKAAQTVHLEKGEKVEKKVEVTATESLNLPLH